MLSIIFWILAGSAVLWIFLLNVLGIAYAFHLVKRLIWGKENKETSKEKNLQFS